MPVRNKVVTWLGERFGGVQTWNGLTGECRTIPTDDYYATRDAADALYVDLIERIDWPRILLESISRHGSLENARVHPAQRGGSVIRGTCADCLQAALLARDRLIDWVSDGAPTPTPAAIDVDDPYRVLGEALRHRPESRSLIRRETP